MSPGTLLDLRGRPSSRSIHSGKIRMTDSFKRGDKVQWNTSQGLVHGTVRRKLTAPTDIKGHHVAASADNPQYLVRSEETGAEAAHKADALTKLH
jgi:hypothetical protein